MTCWNNIKRTEVLKGLNYTLADNIVDIYGEMSTDACARVDFNFYTFETKINKDVGSFKVKVYGYGNREYTLLTLKGYCYSNTLPFFDTADEYSNNLGSLASAFCDDNNNLDVRFKFDKNELLGKYFFIDNVSYVECFPEDTKKLLFYIALKTLFLNVKEVESCNILGLFAHNSKVKFLKELGFVESELEAGCYALSSVDGVNLLYN